MVELFQNYNGQPARVIAGTKRECTASLSKYPHFLWEQVVGFWMHKYFYKATAEEQREFNEVRDEAHAY